MTSGATLDVPQADLPPTDTDQATDVGSTPAAPESLEAFHAWQNQGDGQPDLLHLENVTPNLPQMPQTKWIGGKQYKVVGAVPSEQAPALKPVGTVNDEQVDPSQIVDHDPDFAYEVFKKQHANDKVSAWDFVNDPAQFIGGFAKGLVSGVPTFAKSGLHAAENIGTALSGSAATQDEKVKAANELLGGALSGIQDFTDLTQTAGRRLSSLASVLSQGLIGSRDKELSKDDVVSILKTQSRSRQLQEAVRRGDMPAALKVFGLSEKIADKAYTPEELQKAGYSGERATELGMVENPVNYLPFGELVPAGLAGRALTGVGKAMAYSGSLLDNPFVRWSTHYSPVYAGVAAASGHWQPAAALALSKGLPAIGRTLKTGGEFAGEAGLGLTNPEADAMLAQLREHAGMPEGIVRTAAKRALQSGAVGGMQMLPFTLGAQNPEEAGEMFGFGAEAGAVGMGMREAWKNGVFQLQGGKPINLSGESRIYGSPDDALHAQATANMSKDDIAQINRERHGMQAIGRVFVLPEDVFDTRAGKAKGAAFVVGTDGDVPAIYYRGEAGFQQAKAHEAVHLVSDTLTPEQKAEIYQGIQRQNDMSGYATRYYSDLYKVPIKVDFDSLPDRQPVPNDPYGMTKEKVMEEALADMLSKGKSFSEITQNPDILRRLQLGAGKLAERMGVPLTADETNTVRGVNPSYRAISAIELAMRSLAKDAARTEANYGQAVPDPSAYFGDLRSGLRSMGYKPGESTTLAEDVIDEAKDQNRIVTIDDLLRRAMTGKWSNPPPAVVRKAPPLAAAAMPTAPQPKPNEAPRIAGPALVDENGALIASGKIGDTHVDVMKKAVAQGKEEAINALNNEAQHAFIDTNDEIHNRTSAAKVAVAAKQVPADVTSLQSEHLIQNQQPIPVRHGEFGKEGYTATNEPAPVAEFEKWRQAQQQLAADPLAGLTKQEIAALHRAQERGDIKSEEDLNNWIAQRTSGDRGAKLQAIKQFQESGEPFKVTFTKADGSDRVMNARFGVTEHPETGEKLVKGTRTKLPENPAVYTVFDTDKNEYRTFDIDRVKSIEDAQGNKKFMPEGDKPERIELPEFMQGRLTDSDIRKIGKSYGLKYQGDIDGVHSFHDPVSGKDISAARFMDINQLYDRIDNVRAEAGKKFMPQEDQERQLARQFSISGRGGKRLLVDGAELSEPQRDAWLAEGLVEKAPAGYSGYRLTDKGRGVAQRVLSQSQGERFMPENGRPAEPPEEEEASQQRAERYFEIGQADEEAMSKNTNWIWDQSSRAIKAKQGGTHGSNFGHDVAERTFKGWFDKDSGKISVVFPEAELRRLGGRRPTPDDIPQSVYDALQRKFGKSSEMVAFMPDAEDRPEKRFTEKVAGPAIRVSDIPFTGKTYAEAEEKARAFGFEPNDIKNAERGYLSTKGKWMSPDEASTFASERGQMGEQADAGPLRTQDFNRWRKFMPDEVVRSTGEEDLPVEGRPFEFDFIKNKKKAPREGARFGQHLEPAGSYMQQGVFDPKDADRLTKGTARFENPLVIPWGEGYESPKNWKAVLSERYGGKTGKALSQAIRDDGYDGIVTVTQTRGTPHTSEIVDLRGFEPNERNLVAVHNLSATNLLHADKRGGLAMPSMAITRADKYPFTNFGEISLVGRPDLVRPSREMIVGNSDAYSVRYPTIKYFLDAPSEKALRKIVGDAIEKVPNADKSFNRWSTGAEIDDRGVVEGLKNDAGTQLAYLIDTGQKVPEMTGDQQHDHYEVRKLFYDPEKAAQYEEWLSKLPLNADEKIFRGFTNLGNRRYMEHNLDNVIRVMKGEFKEGEGFNYGAGSVRSKTMQRFRTMRDIQNSRDKIISGEQMDALKEEANNELTSLADELMPLRKNSVDGFGRYDAFSSDLKDLATGGRKNYEYLREQYGDSWDTAIPKMRDYLQKLRDMPSEYFEAKAKRAVGLHEFTGAVVPHDATPEVHDALKKHGLQVETYQRNDPESRRQAVEKLASQRGLKFMPEGFYSQLEKTLEEKMPNRASADQVRGIIAKGAVKKAELDWNSPLRDLLDKGGTLAKEDVMAAVRAGTPELKEVVRGEPHHDAEAWWNDEGGANEETPWNELSPAEQADARQRYQDEVGDFEEDATSHSQWQLPGGENYREIAYTLPSLRKEQGAPPELVEAMKRYGENPTPENAAEYRRLSQQYRKNRQQDYEPPSSHQLPNNTVAHMRVNDRDLPDGKKMLFAEEMQSDWAAAGRKEGWKSEQNWSDADEKRYQGLKAKIPAGSRDKLGMGGSEYEGSFLSDLEEAELDDLSIRRAHTSLEAVPDMPWKGNAWQSLLMRSLIKKAVEGGYDHIGWTTGAQQQERYDLSKQVSSISYAKDQKGYHLKAILKEGGDWQSLAKGIPESKLPDYVGKDLAAKIIKDEGEEMPHSPFKRFDAEDLKVGGEWATNLYDKQLVNIANDLGKKYGARVADVPLREEEVPSRSSARSEITSAADPPRRGLRYQIFDKATGKLLHTIDQPIDIWNKGGSALNEWKKQTVDAALKQYDEPVHVHSLPITEAMRSAVQKTGQPLFQPESGARQPTPPLKVKRSRIPAPPLPNQQRKKDQQFAKRYSAFSEIP